MLESKSIPFNKNVHFLQMIDLYHFRVGYMFDISAGFRYSDCELFAINMTKNVLRDAIVY